MRWLGRAPSFDLPTPAGASLVVIAVSSGATLGAALDTLREAD